jgi:hypothetical protein
MNMLITVITLTITLATLGNAGIGDVISSWPSPKYPNNIIINGITFEGEYIWIKSIDAETNAVLKCTKSGSLVNEVGFPYHGWGYSYGLAYDGTYLWTIYHQPYGPVRLDYYVKYTTNGSETGAFGIHYGYGGYSISVSWDGQYLWTDERFYTPMKAGKYTAAGSLVATFAVPGVWRTDAAYYNNQLWTGGPDDYVYGMNVGASTYVASFAAPGGSCGAVGFDGEYLWTADKNTPQYIYKVDIDVVDVEPGSFGKIKGLYR